MTRSTGFGALAEGALSRALRRRLAAVEKLGTLARQLARLNGGSSSSAKKDWPGIRRRSPDSILWGDVGRGKSMLMDLFFEEAQTEPKRRVHFNGFMADVHARLHAERANSDAPDPIPAVAKTLAAEARLLCFDEFQVTDVADAMILGRLFEQLIGLGTVIVTTSNVAPSHLYEGGLNRQLFMPFITLIETRLDVMELNGLD